MTSTLSFLARRWRASIAYAERLVADVDETTWAAQPWSEVDANGPLWVLGHLSMYGPVIAAVLLDQPIPDTRQGPFARGTQPGDAMASKEEVLVRFLDGAEQAAAALESADEARLSLPNPVERLRGALPETGDLIFHLTTVHQAHHLGQLSGWRKAMGLPAVSMF
ncbi:MAG: DinB family protein [Acidobacteriota bacterium]